MAEVFAVTEVAVYGKPNCALCESCKKKLKIMGVPFAFRDLDNALSLHDNWREDRTAQLLALHTMVNVHVPMVVVNGHMPFDYPGAMKFFKDLTSSGRFDPSKVDNSNVPVPPESSPTPVFTMLLRLEEKAALDYAAKLLKSEHFDGITFTPLYRTLWHYENGGWKSYLREAPTYRVDIRIRYTGRRRDTSKGCSVVSVTGEGKSAVEAVDSAITRLEADKQAQDLALFVGEAEPTKETR